MRNDTLNPATNFLAACGALRSISEHVETRKVYETLLQVALEHSGAERGFLLLCNGQEFFPIGEAHHGEGGWSVRLHDEIGDLSEALPTTILQHVQKKGSDLIVADASQSGPFARDFDLCKRNVRSAACLPLLKQGKVIGLLYLEHGHIPEVFSAERVMLLQLFLAQATTTLENARQHNRVLEENARLLKVDRDLAFQRNLLRTLVESVPHRIYAKDLEGRFTFGNMSVALGMGVSHPDELLGKTDFGFYPKEAAAGYFAEEQHIMRSGAPMVDHEENVNYVLTDDVAWMLTNKVPLRDDAGNIIGLVGINYDITERKRMELELTRRNAELEELTRRLAQAQQQLVQSEKLASIGQLAAGVAHEINNPIGYIFSNFHSLNRYLDDLFAMLAAYEEAEPEISNAAVRESLTSLRQQLDLAFLKDDIGTLMTESHEGIVRVKKIVQDLKDFSRSDTQQDRHPADLHAGIDATLNIINSEIKYRADVVKEYGAIPEVECLASQISQVIMNLLVNAAHAIEAADRGRGTITIRTGTQDDKVWIEIADTGCGIPEKSLLRIFDPFFTTKPVGKGTGLGLSLSYGIVRDHGGKIEVATEVGKGTTFRITLPISPAA